MCVSVGCVDVFLLMNDRLKSDSRNVFSPGLLSFCLLSSGLWGSAGLFVPGHSWTLLSDRRRSGRKKDRQRLSDLPDLHFGADQWSRPADRGGLVGPDVEFHPH